MLYVPGDLMLIAVLAATTAACLVFVTLYTIEWRHIIPTAESRHLMAFTAIIGAIAAEQLIIEVFGKWHGHDEFSALTVFGAAVFLWQRVYLLVRYQVRPRRQRRRAREAANSGDTPLR